MVCESTHTRFTEGSPGPGPSTHFTNTAFKKQARPFVGTARKSSCWREFVHGKVWRTQVVVTYGSSVPPFYYEIFNDAEKLKESWGKHPYAHHPNSPGVIILPSVSPTTLLIFDAFRSKVQRAVCLSPKHVSLQTIKKSSLFADSCFCVFFFSRENSQTAKCTNGKSTVQ